MIKKSDIRGQTALILILLAAAALIFLSITLNWGRVAQAKAMLSIAADQAASLLASEAASYGEMEKQTSLQDSNEISALSGILMDIIMVVVAIIILIIAIYSCGSGAYLYAVVFAVIGVVSAIATLVLQLTVIQPGMNALWNKLQKNQPIEQQFYEQGVGQALQGSVTDQLNIADYFDENTNGVIGAGNIPNDSISRFGFFYTERLKMLNKGDIPQVDLFYNQLNEFMNGETCQQNFKDNSIDPGIPINPSCIDQNPSDAGYGVDYCGNDPKNPDTADPACTGQIPNIVTCAQNAKLNLSSCPSGCISNPSDPVCQIQVSNDYSFQLNDACTDSDPTDSTTYNPYCDPCCQSPTPSGCSSSYPAQCLTNNPYAPYGSYPSIYDPTYQEYANGLSFLDQFGRDQQMVLPAGTLEPYAMTVQGSSANGTFFPNGIYPFFWLMNDYSPEVDNINPATLKSDHSQDHWCVAGGTVPTANNPSATAFPDLTQLGQSGSSFTLPYTCSGTSCCVNYLINGLSDNTTGASTPIQITVGNGISVSISTDKPSYSPGDTISITTGSASEPNGSIAGITFTIAGQGVNNTLDPDNFTLTPSPPASPITFSGSIPIPATGCVGSPLVPLSGSYEVTATATDTNGNIGTGSVAVTINNPGATTCGSSPCGEDSCGNPCGSGCSSGYTCSSTSSPGTCSCSTPCGVDHCSTDACGGACPSGICTAPNTCGAVTPNVCGCAPNCAGAVCGASDGCGGACQTGSCTTGTCTAGVCS